MRDVSGPARLCMKRGALWEEVGRPTIVSWVSQQIHQYKNRRGGEGGCVGIGVFCLMRGGRLFDGVR